MKKFFVGLLSIFMIFGAGLLTACGKDNPTLSVYCNRVEISDTIEIELNPANPEGGYALISAEVSGAKNPQITASVQSGYESNLTVEKVSGGSKTKQYFKLTGITETENPAIVVVQASPGNLQKYVYVDVYSNVSSMVQNDDEKYIASNFLVAGQEYVFTENGIESAVNSMTENQLIKFSPSQNSRRELSWQVKENGEFVDAERFTVASDATNVVLKAIASAEIETQISLPVLKPLSDSVDMLWNNDDITTPGEPDIDLDGNVQGSKEYPYVIVPNIPNDELYQEYAWIKYLPSEGEDELAITPIVEKMTAQGWVKLAETAAEKESQPDTDLWRENNVLVEKAGVEAVEGYTIFGIRSAKSSINARYKISFRVGYADYDYAGTTQDIYFNVSEKIDNVYVTTKTTAGVRSVSKSDTDVVVDLFDNYATTEYARASYGQKFSVLLTPTTVISGSNKYTMTLISPTLDFNAAEMNGVAVSPIQVWYKALSGTMNPVSNFDGTESVSALGEIYIQASEYLTRDTIEGFKLVFTSVDNSEIQTTVGLTLKKSASTEDFGGIVETDSDGDELLGVETGKFVFDSGDVSKVAKKYFKLTGQSTLEGIVAPADTDFVDYSAITKENSHVADPTVAGDKSYIIFSITAKLKDAAYGVTANEVYNISHNNGNKSADFVVEIFLPFDGVTIAPDMGNNMSNSITDITYNENDVDSLMLKNNTTTPILYIMEEVEEKSAVVALEFKYLDFATYAADYISEYPGKTQDDAFDAFKALTDKAVEEFAYPEVGLPIATDSSAVIRFSSNTKDIVSRSSGDIITQNRGYTYLILKFTGRGTGEEVNVCKVVFIENYVAPEGMYVAPKADREIELYASDSVSTEQMQDTTKTITLEFDNSNTTYADKTNIQIASKSNGEYKNVDDFENDYFTINSFEINSAGLSFAVTAVTTENEVQVNEEIRVKYIIVNEKGQTVYEWIETIALTIKNAQRVESIAWRNADPNGLRYEVGSSTAQYILLKSDPANAQNKGMSWTITDQNKNATNSLLTPTEFVSSNTISITLKATVGASGYAYVYPADAVFNDTIKFYYKQQDGNKIEIVDGAISENGEEVTETIHKDDVGENYQDLVKYAYFKSNASGQVKLVPFKNILLEIKIEIEDGSKAHPYKIFNASQFTRVKSFPNLHYEIMQDIELDSWTSIDTFSGGIKGDNENITIKFNSTANFAQNISENATIEKLKFVGQVTGDGFVANINNGTIQNVTVDTNATNASILNSSAQCSGGLVGQNQGQILNSNVYGLSIAGTSQYVGGIAGQNTGTINNVRVEFYNLTGGTNSFAGAYVAGLVGIAQGGAVSYAYAYDYTLTYENADSGIQDPFTSVYYGGTFDHVFAVVGVQDNVDIDGITNYYVGYYEGETYTIISDATDNSYFISGGEGFDAEINGGQPYLKDFHQPKKVTVDDIQDLAVETYSDINRYYKSISVNIDSGIMFYYDITSDKADLSTAEKADLDELNTISLETLFGSNVVNKNVVVTSSNNQVVKITGSSAVVVGRGETTLALSSKHDVAATRTITVKVLNSLSDLVISFNESNGNTNYVDGKKEINIQKTKSKDFDVKQTHTNVILGNLANVYEVVVEDYKLKTASYKVGDPSVTTNIATVEEFDTGVKLRTSQDTIDTTVEIVPEVDALDGNFDTAIKNVFKKAFNVKVTEGVINFAISGESVSITPSISAVVKAQIQTTAQNDKIAPVVSLGGVVLEANTVGGLIEYSNAYGEKILTAQVPTTVTDIDQIDNLYTYNIDVIFSVHQEYKDKVSQNLELDAYFVADSGNISDQFKIVIARQEFTNIDVVNTKIKQTTRLNSVGEVYEKGVQTSTLAPGNSSVLKVNVNPQYAYYDYAVVTYSGTEGVPGAVNIEAVQNYSDQYFCKLKADHGTVQKTETAYKYTPIKDKGELYFKLWINTSVARDTTIVMTVSFYKNGQAKALDYVNYYLTISYLAEPTITIAGEEIAYVAKGSSEEVIIEVLENQQLDNLTIGGNGIEGIYLSQAQDLGVDPARGVRTYKAYLSCYLNAETQDKNIFTIHGTVSRELNGYKEIKTTSATAVVVDFKIDEIKIANAVENNLTIWQNVAKTFDVEYSIAPESYPNIAEYADQIKFLNEARASFAKDHIYPKEGEINPSDPTQTEYYINYVKTGIQSFDSRSVLERIFYVAPDGTRTIWNDSSLDLPFEFNEDETGILQIKGIKANTASTTMVLETYIYAGGVVTTQDTFFTVTVETFSDPDLPLPIKSAEDFLALDPSKATATNGIKPQDYILENDIVLENYTPFNTSAIRSLEGNGYTIYIKSFNMETAGVLNIALFNTVTELTVTETNPATETTLKNLRVNYYNGGQLIIDVSSHKEINVAGLAIENSGVIYNCEVVSFHAEALNGESLTAESELIIPSVSHSKPQGFNISYRNGANEDEVFIADNSNWSSNVAGFVLTNNGNITNSRVGGDEVIMVNSDVKDGEGVCTGTTKASTKILDTFNIIGQGDMAGFVLNNNGHISASYVKNLDMTNRSAATKFYTAGFVGTNNLSGSVLTSYIEGVKTDERTIVQQRQYLYANIGSSLKSEMGYLAGFTYKNIGSIKDSYSNILIANSTDLQKVYLASGFVYINDGTIENGYSASQVANATYSQMNFSGVDKNGQLLKEGEYINCYFFNSDQYQPESADSLDNTTETQYATGAMLIKNPTLMSSFYGFAVTQDLNRHSDGIWEISENAGIKLTEADYITYSHRYKAYVSEDYTGITLTDEEDQKYILPYATISVQDQNDKVIDTSLGGSNNPILIADADDWQAIAGSTTSSYIKQYCVDNTISGVYRMVNNINLSGLTERVLSSEMILTGAIYGNGFEISGISITQNTDPNASVISKMGLFAFIMKKELSPALVSNLDMQISQVTAGSVPAVGGLAGVLKQASVINIDIEFAEDALIEGLNFVGGLAGIAYDNNKIKNIVITNPNVIADKYTESESADNFLTSTTLVDFRGNIVAGLDGYLLRNAGVYSYAGSVVGLIDNYTVEASKGFVYSSASDTLYDVNNIRVNGNVNVKGQVAGGVFGLTGYNTDIRDVGITVNGGENANTHIIATRYYAGGLVGQAFGKISRSFAEHDKTTQDAIEDEMGAFYDGAYESSERGLLDIFDTTHMDIEYTQKAVGGLLGYVGSGYLEVSYSKLNATSMSADYAGGIFGEMDVSQSEIYKVESDYIAAMYKHSKYFVNEVFATGDIRARVMAGGLIGLIQNRRGDASEDLKSQIALLSVNAVNYFTLYNYETQVYETLVEGQDEASSNFKVHSIVGEMHNSEGQAEEFARKIADIDTTKEYYGIIYDKTLTKENWTNYIEFVQAQEVIEGGSNVEGETNQTPVPSVAHYIYYQFAGHRVRLKRFGENILLKDDGNGNEVYDMEQENSVDERINLYTISAPNNFKPTNELADGSTAGRTYTQAGFINSGIWSYGNWHHPINDLFPSIKLKEIYSVLYLDAYNAGEVLEKMATKHRDAIVIVRGLKQEGLEPNPRNVEHIRIWYEDSIAAFEAHNVNGEQNVNSFQKLVGFAGRIVGGRYKDSNGEFIKIFATNNFIESTGAGFTISNQTIEYTTNVSVDNSFSSMKTSEAIEIENGLFVNSQIADSNITTLTIVLHGQVLATGENGNSYGIVAPEIISTNIDGLELHIGNIATGDNILQVGSDANTLLGENVHVGLLAGLLKQTNVERIMNVKKVKIKHLNPSQFNGATDTFGAISVIGKVTPVIPFGKTKEESALSVGGFFGSIEKGVDEEDYFGNKSTPQALQAPITSFTAGTAILHTKVTENDVGDVDPNDKLDVLNFGGYAGLILGVDQVSVSEGDTLTAKTLAQIEQVSTQANVGGLVGAIESNSHLTINGANATIDFAIANDIEAENLKLGGFIGYNSSILTVSSVDSVKFNTNEKHIDANGETYIGGLVGHTTGRLIMTGDIAVTGAIDVECGVIGGILGAAEATEYLEINGKITSNLDVDMHDVVLSVFGGIVGKIKQVNKAIIQGRENGIIRYDGDVNVYTTDYSELTFGGVVGSIEDHSVVTMSNTSFGGSCNMREGKIALIAGGSIGQVLTSGTDSSGCTITLEDSYNYGDVFIDNNNVSNISWADFGGLIGNSGKSEGYNIKNNYSIVTYHNTRYLTNSLDGKLYDVCANALFGTIPSQTSGEVKFENNYYSHSVCLLTDEYGTDVGYMTAYDTSRAGYDNSTAVVGDNGLAQVILNKIGGKELFDEDADGYLDEIENEQGHKLNPIELTNAYACTSDAFDDDKSEWYTGEYNFNGLAYYVAQEDLSLTKENYTVGINRAIIGDAFKITYKNGNTKEKTAGDAKLHALFEDVCGYSFVSSMRIDVDVYIDDGSSSYASAVAFRPVNGSTTHPNTQLYTVNVVGELNVGSSEIIHLNGLAYNVQGKVTDCSTDLDIVERGASPHTNNTLETSSIRALGGISQDLKGEKGAIIENCYTLGSIQTLSGSILNPFISQDHKGPIKNCYSATKMDWRNYLDEKEGLISQYCKDEDIIYCQDGLNVAGIEGTVKSYGQMNDNPMTNMDVDSAFAYGYPTLKYQYMKTSSYATQDTVEYGCGHNHSDPDEDDYVADKSTYDCYIETYEYNRVDNGQAESGFYMIPDAGVLNAQLGVDGGCKNDLALKYDMDLVNTSDSIKELGLFEVSGINMDGQGKTISGLIKPLFGSLNLNSNKYVKNLRLTDATLSITEGENSVIGILAQNSQSGVISNITVSGNIATSEDVKLSKYSKIGGVVGYSKGSGTMSNITNMATVNVNVSGRENVTHYTTVGGVVGLLEGSTILYASNYGPINIEAGPKSAVSAGGIVGVMSENATVKYSHNSTSVLNGYTSASYGGYYTGGIAGFVYKDAAGAIEYCYNTGMIKSGNKNNGVHTEENAGATLRFGSHAGGILAHVDDDASATITHCYNEGSVEALAQNGDYKMVWKKKITERKQGIFGPTYEIRYEDVGQEEYFLGFYEKWSEGIIPTLEMQMVGVLQVIQSSIQNVWAYEIGPQSDISSIAKIETNLQTGERSVLANGAALSKDSVIYELEYQKSWAPVYSEFQYGKVYEFGVDAPGWRVDYMSMIEFTYAKTDMILNCEEDENKNKVFATEIVGTNFMGIPTAFTYTIPYSASVQYKKARDVVPNTVSGWNDDRLVLQSLYTEKEWSGLEEKQTSYMGYSSTIDETFVMGINGKNITDGNFINEDENIFVTYQDLAQDGNIYTEGTGDSIIKNTRSQKTAEYQQILVNGVDYYIVDNNSLDYFGLGLNEQTLEFLTNIPYSEDNKYEPTLSFVDDGDIQITDATSWSIISYNYSSYTNEVDAKEYIKAEVTVAYLNNSGIVGAKPKLLLTAKNLEEKTLDFSKTNFYNAGINGIGLGYSEEGSNPFTLNLQAEESVELLMGENELQSDNIYKATDKDGNKYYLYWNGEDFIYYKDLTLKSGTNTSEVNTIDLLISEYTSTTPLNLTFKTNPSKVDMIFSNSGSDSYTLKQGKKVERDQKDPLPNDGGTRLFTTENVFDGTTPDKDAIILDDSGNPIVSFSKSGNVWKNSSGNVVNDLSSYQGKTIITQRTASGNFSSTGVTRTETVSVGNYAAQLTITVTYTAYSEGNALSNMTFTLDDAGGQDKTDVSLIGGKGTDGWKTLNGVSIPYFDVYESEVMTGYTMSKNSGDIDAVYDLSYDETSIQLKSTDWTKVVSSGLNIANKEVKLDVYQTYEFTRDLNASYYQFYVERDGDSMLISSEDVDSHTSIVVKIDGDTDYLYIINDFKVCSEYDNQLITNSASKTQKTYDYYTWYPEDGVSVEYRVLDDILVMVQFEGSEVKYKGFGQITKTATSAQGITYTLNDENDIQLSNDILSTKASRNYNEVMYSTGKYLIMDDLIIERSEENNNYSEYIYSIVSSEGDFNSEIVYGIEGDITISFKEDNEKYEIFKTIPISNYIMIEGTHAISLENEMSTLNVAKTGWENFVVKNTLDYKFKDHTTIMLNVKPERGVDSILLNIEYKKEDVVTLETAIPNTGADNNEFGIVLDKDISLSFERINSAIPMGEDIKVIGNGYCISWYGDFVYSTISGLIKNVNLLCETRGDNSTQTIPYQLTDSATIDVFIVDTSFDWYGTTYPFTYEEFSWKYDSSTITYNYYGLTIDTEKLYGILERSNNGDFQFSYGNYKWNFILNDDNTTYTITKSTRVANTLLGCLTDSECAQMTNINVYGNIKYPYVDRVQNDANEILLEGLGGVINNINIYCSIDLQFHQRNTKCNTSLTIKNIAGILVADGIDSFPYSSDKPLYESGKWSYTSGIVNQYAYGYNELSAFSCQYGESNEIAGHEGISVGKLNPDFDDNDNYSSKTSITGWKKIDGTGAYVIKTDEKGDTIKDKDGKEQIDEYDIQTRYNFSLDYTENKNYSYTFSADFNGVDAYTSHKITIWVWEDFFTWTKEVNCYNTYNKDFITAIIKDGNLAFYGGEEKGLFTDSDVSYVDYSKYFERTGGIDIPGI